ncbi:MAG: ATP-binding cassette domain-containing protein, partial [Spirochaetaceae bacterium]|nr:ATP-binding cassette domain-containing protein [Spirochaetaceae bacterium]
MNDKGKPGVPAFVMRQVSKVYPGTIAVDKVDFDIHPGEVHALIGENGAGKSTLMKMMAGSFDDYTGEIQVNGEIVQLHSPAVAKRHGIEMIYQELSLAMPISIAENVLVGRLPKKGAFIDRTRMNIETTECLEKVG